MKHLSLTLLSLLVFSFTLLAQYDADTQDFFDRAEVLDPDAFDLTSNHPALTPTYVKGQWDAYVKRLKADGVWASKVEILPLAWISWDALGCKLKYDTTTNAAYTSDFSAGADGWTATNGAVAGNIDSIGGQNDNLRFTIDGTLGTHQAVYTGLLTVGRHYSISLDVYIPSTNSNIDGLILDEFPSGGQYRSTDPDAIPADTWTSVSVEGIPTAAQFRVKLYDGTANSFQDAGADDVIYIRNVVVTELSPSTAINNGFTSGQYDAIQGLTGNGSSYYFDTGYFDTMLSGNDVHMGAFVVQHNGQGYYVAASDNTTYFFGVTENGANQTGYYGPFLDAAIVAAESNGHHLISRRSTTDIEAYKNGESAGTDNSSASFSFGGSNVYVFARPPGSIISSATLSLAHYGTGLTDQQAADAYEALDTLRFSMTAPPSVILAGGPRDIGHTDTDYGYWDPSSLPTVTVTSLADSGTGTLRALLDGVSNVRVAFAVEGEIKLQSEIAPGSSVFIDGSTAPGQGVSISGDQLNFGAQSNIWIQDIAFLGGDYMLPMPSRMTAFEDQGSGVWLDDSSRFWARLTADTHIDSVWHSSAGVLSAMTELTKDTTVSTPVVAGDIESGKWYFDADQDKLFVNTGNGDGSDVNNGTLAIQLSKSLHPDCLTLTNCTQIVLAHNTFLGGTDITMQVDNCRYTWLYANIIGRPIGYRYQVEQTDANIAKGDWANALHAKGILFKMDQGETNKNLNTGLARNFFIDCPDRSPRLADGGSYLLLNNYNVSTDGMNITLQNDTFGDGVASVIGNYFDTTSQTDYSVIHGVPEIEVDANGTIYLADGTPDEANYFDGALQTDPWAKQNTGFFKADDNSDKAATVVVPSPSTNPDPTAQGGGASTITLDAATSSAVDDTYNNHYIVLTANTGSGQQAFITDYDGGTKVATVNTAWSTQPDNTTTYEIRYGVLPASILSAAHDTVTGYTILSAADAKTWVAANAGPRRDRNRPAIVNELANRAVTPPPSFHWPTNDGIRPAGGYDPDAEDYIRRARLLDPIAFNQTSISDSYTSLTIEAAVSNMIERLKDANVWEDTTEWLNLAGVSYDGLAAKLKRDTSITITDQTNFAGGTDGYTAANGTAAAPITIGGRDNTLRLTLDATSNVHNVSQSLLTSGRYYELTGRVYVASTNSNVDGFIIKDASAGITTGTTYDAPATDEWVTFSVSGVAANASLVLQARDGGADTFQDAGGDDVIYFRDIIVRAVSPAEAILTNFTSGQYLAAGSGAGLTGVPASTTYINSGYWFPNFDGNDLHLGAYVANNSSSPSMALLGATDSTSNVVSLEDDSVNFEVNLPDSDAQIAGGSSASGYLLGSRRSSTDIESYFNGVSAATDASSLSFSSGDIAENLAVFARLDDVAGEEFLTDATLAAAHYGNGWTTAQALAAYKALRDYLRTIGAN